MVEVMHRHVCDLLLSFVCSTLLPLEELPAVLTQRPSE